MKRFKRKVGNSDSVQSDNAGTDSTIDRRTFFECSNRMKRIVPTLGRRESIDSCQSKVYYV